MIRVLAIELTLQSEINIHRGKGVRLPTPWVLPQGSVLSAPADHGRSAGHRKATGPISVPMAPTPWAVGALRSPSAATLPAARRIVATLDCIVEFVLRLEPDRKNFEVDSLAARGGINEGNEEVRTVLSAAYINQAARQACCEFSPVPYQLPSAFRGGKGVGGWPIFSFSLSYSLS